MFHNSSHRKYWIFRTEDEVEHMRYKANQKFRNKILESGKVSEPEQKNEYRKSKMGPCVTVLTFSPPVCLHQPGVSESTFLERHEEDVLFRHYEKRLLDFCNAFKPAMPKSVVVCMHLSFHKCQNNMTLLSIYVYLRRTCLTCAGYSHHVLQKILPEQLHHGVPPKDYHVSNIDVDHGKK